MKKLITQKTCWLLQALGMLFICTNTCAETTPQLSFHTGPLIANDYPSIKAILGDVDGDGNMDIINAHSNLNLQKNDGHGNFDKGTKISNDYLQVETLALGDVDADGDLDLVVGRVSNTLLIFINNGHGNFSPNGIAFSAEEIYARSLSLVDVDIDGDIDIVVSHQTGIIAIYHNDGNGHFSTTSKAFGDKKASVSATAFGDIDGDGDLDLIAGGKVICRFINDGKGNFSNADYTIEAEGSWNKVSLADLDGDGDLDLLAANYSEHQVYLNDGYGVFTLFPNKLSTTSDSSYSNALGDVDGDGDLDLLISNHETPNQLYLNNGQGLFTPMTPNPMEADTKYNFFVALADVDGDQDLDLIALNGGKNDKIFFNDSNKQPKAQLKNLTQVIPNKTNNQPQLLDTSILSSSPIVIPTNKKGDDLAAADIDNDGDIDLVVSYEAQSQSFLTFYRNNGQGELSLASELVNSVEDAARSLLFADIDGDSKPDLLVGHRKQLITLHHNNGDGTFAEGIDVGLKADHTNELIVSDIDGDGDPDLIAANGGKSKRYLNEGKGNFSTGRTINRNDTYSSGVVANDIDHDNDIDIVFCNDKAGVVLHSNNGDGTFDADGKILFDNTQSNCKLFAADFNNDNNIDLLVTGQTMLALLNQGQNNFTPMQELITSRRIELADVDMDNDLDIMSDSMLLLNDGNAGWSPYNNKLGVIDSRAFLLADMDGDRDNDLVILPPRDNNIFIYANSSRYGAIDKRIALKAEALKLARTPPPSQPKTPMEHWLSEIKEINRQYNLSGILIALLIPIFLYILIRRITGD